MHIFITGGTRGIGFGLVNEFLKRKHNVSYTGTSQASIDLNINELQGNYLPIICDVRKKLDILNASKQAIEKFGPIDIWINNAGVSHKSKYITDLTELEIKKVINTNVSGMILATSIALNHMKEHNKGIVYNMEGLGSNNMKIAKTIVYGSSKRLLTYFSEACNKELKDYKDIFVGTMQPGMVFTELLLDDLGEGDKIAKILGSKVEDVTPYLVKKALKHKKHIKYLTKTKILWRFIFSIF